jgi:hypothetical protein
LPRVELFFVSPFVTLTTLSEKDTTALSQGSARRTSTREDSNTRFITAEKCANEKQELPR